MLWKVIEINCLLFDTTRIITSQVFVSIDRLEAGGLAHLHLCLSHPLVPGNTGLSSVLDRGKIHFFAVEQRRKHW